MNDEPADANEGPGGNQCLCDSFFYALHDPMYNVIGLVNSSGALLERYEYTPYGQRTVFISPGANGSLPMSGKSFRMSLKERYYWVPSGMTLYAMQRLVLTYPGSRLSEEARRLRQEYLDSATKVLPPPRDIQVTAWDAKYEESDPRIAIMDPRRKVLASEPWMSIPLYPWALTDGSRISEQAGETSPKAKELFGKLESFVNAAYGTQ